jgi:hypothetical protein
MTGLAVEAAVSEALVSLDSCGSLASDTPTVRDPADGQANAANSGIYEVQVGASSMDIRLRSTASVAAD